MGAELLRRWATARACTVLPFNQPPGPTQPGHPAAMSTYNDHDHYYGRNGEF